MPAMDKLKKHVPKLVTITLVAVALCSAYVLYSYYTAHPWTRDGQVRANVVEIAPRVSGYLVQIAVKDNQSVQEGQLLFQIDPSSYQLAVDQAQVDLDQARQDVVALEAAVRAAEATVKQQNAGVNTAESQIDEINPGFHVGEPAWEAYIRDLGLTVPGWGAPDGGANGMGYVPVKSQTFHQTYGPSYISWLEFNRGSRWHTGVSGQIYFGGPLYTGRIPNWDGNPGPQVLEGHRLGEKSLHLHVVQAAQKLVVRGAGDDDDPQPRPDLQRLMDKGGPVHLLHDHVHHQHVERLLEE